MNALNYWGFELSPFRSEQAKLKLAGNVTKFADLKPGWMTVTFGAGGSAREGTLETLQLIRDVLIRENAAPIPLAAHLTCYGLPVREVESFANTLWKNGISEIVALTGDIPGGQTMPDGHYPSSDKLVAALCRMRDFKISVAGHPDFTNDRDMDGLKRKIDAGAVRIITQYDFDAEKLVRYRDRVRTAGIAVPVALGLMPIRNFGSVAERAAQHKVKIADEIGERFAEVRGDVSAEREEGRKLFEKQTAFIVREGGHLHVYTLNQPEPCVGTLAKILRGRVDGRFLALAMQREIAAQQPAA